MRHILLTAAAAAALVALSANAKDEKAAPAAQKPAGAASATVAASGGEAGGAPQTPAVTLPDQPLAVQAAAYALYQADVSKLEAAPFQSLKDIDAGLEAVSSYAPDRLASAWIAYSALVAAQSP